MTDRLTWVRNTEEIAKKSFKRMRLHNTAAAFTSSTNDLKNIYLTFIRSVLEQSAVVWNCSLSKTNKKYIERVQKAAVKVILGKTYTTYKKGLKYLNLYTVDRRRENLCINFGKKCIKTDKIKHLSPLENSNHKMKTRNKQKFTLYKQNTKRYQKSSIPYMRRLLNNEYKKKEKVIDSIDV